MDWISDRLPTREDADSDGDVCLHWDHRDDLPRDPYAHWSKVTPGMKWRRSDYWVPEELR